MAKAKAKKRVVRPARARPAGTGVPALVDLTPEEILKLPKPRDGFAAHVARLLALYRSEPELAIKGFDADAVALSFRSYQALQPLEESAAKHLEMVQETRLLASSNAWSGVLKIYGRAQNVAKTNPDVARAIADFGAFMKLGPRKTKPAGG